MNRIAACLILSILLVGCTFKKHTKQTPWGTPTEADTTYVPTEYMLSDIVTNGELIALTLSGPETYYDYHGRGMGFHYLLCEQFAHRLGVSLRVEVCKDTLEMVEKLRKGEGDVIAFPLKPEYKDIRYCGLRDSSQGSRWAVRESNIELADSLDTWYTPRLVAKIRKEEAFFLSDRSVTRRVYAPMLNRAGGVISRYDHLFRQYAGVARCDWRLLAAQCYQESTFDPQARSWAGACGLMPIMPATADHLGLPRNKIFEPEANIAAAARYMRELAGHFTDVPLPSERMRFVLGAYNGGFFHIRDAMALAEKYGRNKHRWADVSEFVLKLSDSHFYRDPVVKYGYMRGSETADYVKRIESRWASYRGSARPEASSSGQQPAKAKKKNRYS